MNKSIRISVAPARIMLFWNGITLFLYLFGPYDYSPSNMLYMTIFVCVSNVAAYWGFSRGTVTPFISIKSQYNPHFNKLFNLFFWIAVFSALPSFVIFTGIYKDGINTVLSRIQLWSTNAQALYTMKQTEVTNAVGIWRYLNYALVLTGFISWAFIPMSMYCWKMITPFKRICTLAMYMLYILKYVISGTNAGVFEFFIMLGAVILIRNAKRGKRIKVKRKVWIWVLIIGIILITVFSIVMSSRIGDSVKVIGSGKTRAILNENSAIYALTPDALKQPLLYFTRYFCSPYSAICLAMDQPFSSTLGLGNSWFLIDNFKELFNWNIIDQTYNMKIYLADGYHYYANWHTVYLWIANDVSFFGVPLVLFILMMIFGRAWRDFLDTSNIFAFLLVALFVRYVMYMPANNNVFANSNTLFGFFIYLALWLSTRNRDCASMEMRDETR